MREVKWYIKGYDICQRNKNHTKRPTGKLRPNIILEKLWTHIPADFITKLPLAQDYDLILVVYNQFLKITHFVATAEKTSVKRLARLFQDHIWKSHKLSESIISDMGPQFAAELMKKLNRMLGIDTRLSTAFYPQTDEQMKRLNHELEQYLRIFIDHRQELWLEWLGTIEFAYNNKVHLATQMLPFINSGQKLRIGFEMRKKEKSEKMEKFAKMIEKVQKEVEVALRKT